MKDLLSHRFSGTRQERLAYLSENQIAYRDLVKKKMSTGYRLVPNPCPCSQGGEMHDIVISEIDRYGLPLQSVLCTRCGTVRIDPYLDEKSLSDFYTGYYQEMYGRSEKVAEYFEKQKQYGRKFYNLAKDFLTPASQVLEFGCGAGGALTVFKEHGHDVYGIEYSQKLLDFGKSQGLDNLFYGSIEDLRHRVGTDKFDLIFSNHVFEHVNLPLQYLRHCMDLLKPEGRIICSVPDIYGSRKYSFPNSDLRLMLHIAHIYNYSFECLQAMAHRLKGGIRRIFPDEKIITPTSVMPEMWFEITRADAEGETRNLTANGNYLHFFKETENNFLTGTDLLKAKVSMKDKIKRSIKNLLLWKK